MIVFTQFQHSLQNTPVLTKLHQGAYQNMQGHQAQAVEAVHEQVIKQQKMVHHSDKTDDARIRERERRRHKNKKNKQNHTQQQDKDADSADSDHLIDFIA